MYFTDHAVRRAQQRGIRQDHMELLAAFGQRVRRPGGSFAYTLNRKGRVLLERNGVDKQLIDKLRHQVLIESSDGSVITVYHRN